MFSLNSGEQLFKMSKELDEDDIFYDMIFITGIGMFYGHSSLIFKYSNELTQ